MSSSDYEEYQRNNPDRPVDIIRGGPRGGFVALEDREDKEERLSGDGDYRDRD